jgi:hypothetical protein
MRYVGPNCSVERQPSFRSLTTKDALAVTRKGFLSPASGMSRQRSDDAGSHEKRQSEFDAPNSLWK